MNSQLYDKKYPIPVPIVQKIRAKLMATDGGGEGVKRAKFLVNNGYATYQMLKRIKNFFDHFDMNENSHQEFELSGGEDMRNYIEHTLNSDRANVKRSKDLKRPSQPNINKGLTSPAITEAEDVENNEDLNINVVVVVLNEEKKLLLLKRSSYEDQWMPNKWCMPGGGVEKGEQPANAAIRELKEETGITVEKFKESFVIQRDDNVEHIFLSLYEGDPWNIKLDNENQGYGWFSINEIKFLDTVPNLLDYINISIKKYE